MKTLNEIQLLSVTGGIIVATSSVDHVGRIEDPNAIPEPGTPSP